MRRYSSLASLVSLCLIGASFRPVDSKAPSPVDVRVLWTPIPFESRGLSIFAYELRVANVTAHDVILAGLDVRGDSANGPILLRVRGDSLKGITVPIGARDTTAPVTLLKSGRSVTMFAWLELPGSTPHPRALVHRLLVSRPDSLGAPPDTVGPVSLQVPSVVPAVLRSPLDGGPWLARNGPSNTADHRRTFIAVDGVSRIAQRFATDWLMLGPDHRLWKGDSTVNRNWYGYGQKVRAVAAGTIVAIHDGVPENVPLSAQRAVPITLETAAGNCIIQQVGDKQFALYAHLQPGSIRVRSGQRIRPGDVIGLLGNSGNSGAPHLHFHLMDSGESPLGGEGIPFVFRGFLDLGTLKTLDALFGPRPWQPESTVSRRGELPTENEVVDFEPSAGGSR